MDLKCLIYDYLHCKEIFLENDFIQLCNNLHYREIEVIDYLELIIAQVRMDMFKEISGQLFQVLAMTEYQSIKQNKN